MEFLIREERVSDRSSVNELIKASFKNVDQVILCEMLKNRKEFVKELSLVAEINGITTGYILLSPVYIQTLQSSIKSLLLEPVCVLPQFQGRGIGKAIVTSALVKARCLGFESVFVTGSLKFYSRFGFKEAKNYGITPSVQILYNAFLALELKEEKLNQQGVLIYPEEIFD